MMTKSRIWGMYCDLQGHRDLTPGGRVKGVKGRTGV